MGNTLCILITVWRTAKNQMRMSKSLMEVTNQDSAALHCSSTPSKLTLTFASCSIYVLMWSYAPMLLVAFLSTSMLIKVPSEKNATQAKHAKFATWAWTALTECRVCRHRWRNLFVFVHGSCNSLVQKIVMRLGKYKKTDYTTSNTTEPNSISSQYILMMLL